MHPSRSARRGISGLAVLALACLALVAPSGAGAAHERSRPRDLAVSQVNLVSDLPTVGASLVDPDLVNPWGLALGPTTPLWSANNGTDTATLYSSAAGSTTATKVPAVRVTLPGAPSLPTGQVFNPTTGFVLDNGTTSAPAAFIFSSQSGQILAWSPRVDPLKGDAEVKVPADPDNVYTGLALATASAGPQLYAANFSQRRIDVFDSKFAAVPLKSWQFTDSRLPRGYAPFGVHTLQGHVYVAYAKVDPATGEELAGRALGFVDEYSPDGVLLSRVIGRHTLDAPWGLALAPASWGSLAGKLLVGNFGDGRISVVDPTRHHRHHHGQHYGHHHGDHGRFQGKVVGLLRNADTGHKLIIPGLWALVPGTATTGGTDAVWFSAGIEDETHGLIGVLRRP
jgi:uncharacterized protein (TIGR03118 family)